MRPISHKYLEKLHKEATDLDSWLSGTQAQEDGSARPDDLKTLYARSYSIYQKALALHQTTLEEPAENDDFEELRQEVAKFYFWLATEVGNTPNVEERKNVFTRANAISLKALSLFRDAAQQVEDPQEPAGDEHASLSGS